MSMTLEQVRDWHRQRETTFRRLGAPDTANEHRNAADAIDAHLNQPAQSVDVEKSFAGIRIVEDAAVPDGEIWVRSYTGEG